jgi:large subunit ribosomal protein L30
MAKKAESSKGSALKITLTRGLVHKMEKHRKVVEGLGLKSFGHSVIHLDSPTIRGMVRKVHHLVTVEPTNEQPVRKERKVYAAAAAEQ